MGVILEMISDNIWITLFILMAVKHLVYVWFNRPEYIGEYFMDENEGSIYLKLDSLERLEEASHKKYIVLRNSHK